MEMHEHSSVELIDPVGVNDRIVCKSGRIIFDYSG
jgi:hypothetical protein